MSSSGNARTKARSLRDDALAATAAALADRPYARRGVAVSAGVIRVLLVDDHAILRQGLRAILRGVPDVMVVGEAHDGVEALDAIVRTAPDVVLMDLDMPGGDGATATQVIARMQRPPKVLILTMHVEDEYLVPLLRAGASGFLSKDTVERDLLDAVRAVAAGETYVRPRVARLLAAGVRSLVTRGPADEARARFEQLSEREQQVLRLTAEGYNGPEVGSRLGVTAKTVDTYKHRIQEKLGLEHRRDYVRFALAAELIGGGAPNARGSPGGLPIRYALAPRP